MEIYILIAVASFLLGYELGKDVFKGVAESRLNEIYKLQEIIEKQFEIINS